MLHPKFSIDPIPDPRSGRTFGPCSKCSSSDMRVDFHRGRMIDCKYNGTCASWEWATEHLSVTCSRCHHAWLERISNHVNIPDGRGPTD